MANFRSMLEEAVARMQALIHKLVERVHWGSVALQYLPESKNERVDQLPVLVIVSSPGKRQQICYRQEGPLRKRQVKF